jgi:hypothetical protein
MRIELSYTGVAKNRVYFATEAKAGRPRKTKEIVKSKKVFATGSNRSEAISNYLAKVGFTPANAS